MSGTRASGSFRGGENDMRNIIMLTVFALSFAAAVAAEANPRTCTTTCSGYGNTRTCTRTCY